MAGKEDRAMGITDKTLNMIKGLSESQRVKVFKVVNHYVHACRRSGLRPEGMDRVYAEAMEEVKLAEQHPEPEVALVEECDYEPYRRYSQYQSP